jgi:hypothetical protein
VRVSRFSKGPVGALIGVLVGLVAAASLTTGVAGASTTIGAGTSAQTPAVAPAAFTVGTYTAFLNGSMNGTISFASNFTYTSTIEGNDAGSWIDVGKRIVFDVTSGTDASGQCIFVGNVTSKTSIGSAASPGKFSCPGLPVNGTWYVKGSGSGAVHASTGLSAASGSAAAPSVFSIGKYELFVNGAKFSKLTYDNGHSFTLTVGNNGTWETAGNAFGMEITGGAEGNVGCLFVGTLSPTGINSAPRPGPFTGCSGGDTIQGDWSAAKK